MRGWRSKSHETSNESQSYLAKSMQSRTIASVISFLEMLTGIFPMSLFCKEREGLRIPSMAAVTEDDSKPKREY